MNRKQIFEEKLKEYNYQYTIRDGKILINSEKPLIVVVDFNDNNVKITSLLTKWNFITGSLEMTIKKTFKYVFYQFIFFSFLLVFLALLFYNKKVEIANYFIALISTITILFFLIQFILLYYYKSCSDFLTLNLVNWIDKSIENESE